MNEYKLKTPLEVKKGGKKTTIETIQLEGLKVKHFKIMPEEIYEGKNANPGEYAKLISRLSGIEEEYIDEMGVADYMNLMGMVTDELGEWEGSQTDGKKPSGA